MLVIVMLLAKKVSLILLNADNDTGTHDTNMETFVNYIRENIHTRLKQALFWIYFPLCVMYSDIEKEIPTTRLKTGEDCQFIKSLPSL